MGVSESLGCPVRPVEQDVFVTSALRGKAPEHAEHPRLCGWPTPGADLGRTSAPGSGAELAAGAAPWWLLQARPAVGAHS